MPPKPADYLEVIEANSHALGGNEQLCDRVLAEIAQSKADRLAERDERRAEREERIAVTARLQALLAERAIPAPPATQPPSITVALAHHIRERGGVTVPLLLACIALFLAAIVLSLGGDPSLFVPGATP